MNHKKIISYDKIIFDQHIKLISIIFFHITESRVRESDSLL